MVSNLQEGLALADYLGSILAVAAFNPITSLGVTSLWAFPLSAWFWRRRFKMPVQSSWAYLDSSSYPVNFPRQAIFQLKLALIIGLINGLLFCLMIPVIRATILDRLSIYLESINFQYIVLARLGAGAAIAAIMQACGAIIAAVWIKRMGILHGLFSAFISACIMSVGMVSVAVLNTGKIDFFIDLPIFYMVINGGAIISLLFALVPSQIAAWVRSARSLKPTTLNEQIA
jgi:hypothetical protein